MCLVHSRSSIVMWDQTTAQRLGNVLKSLRTDAGLSQESLAYQAGITKNQLQLIEAGRSTGRTDAAGPSNPRMATLTGLAVVLGVPASEILKAADL